ncbi:hypothetical protein [Halomonas litopenaei]|uniref:hypothetical protein n=1 Tax=Halomonas litopenaei TaxID=2109328 RepID=UPI003FA10525
MSDSDNRTNPDISTSGDSTIGATPGNTNDRADDVKDKYRQTADQVRNVARAQAEGMFDRQKTVAANQADSLAMAFHKMADELDAQDQRSLHGYATNIARTTDVISQRLREQNMDTLMYQLKDYSRHQPALFLGGAITAGFLLARFLNSSQQGNSSSTNEGSRPTTAGSRDGSPGTQPY